MKVRKAIQNYILAAVLAIASIIEAVSGFVLWFALPHGAGVGGGQGWRALINGVSTFWGFTRDNWVSIHDWAAVALVVIVIAHIVMHWKWVVRMTQQISREVRGIIRSPEPARVIDTVVKL